jgi:hypothetical protein
MLAPGWAGKVELVAVEVAGELAEGEAVADGEGHVVDVGLGPGSEMGPWTACQATDEVGAVEDDDCRGVVADWFFRRRRLRGSSR